MLTNYSWDMTGYAPKFKPLLGEERITLVEAERIFQLQPEPPEMENLNTYVLLAILKKELKYAFESCVVLDGNQTIPREATSCTQFESCVVLDGNQTAAAPGTAEA